MSAENIKVEQKYPLTAIILDVKPVVVRPVVSGPPPLSRE